MAEKLRVGRKVGRTIYLQLGTDPSDHDPLVGVMDTPELAADVVEAVDARRVLAELEAEVRSLGLVLTADGFIRPADDGTLYRSERRPRIAALLREGDGPN